MPFTYEHEEVAILDATQKSHFVTFVMNVWDGASGDITGVSIRRQGPSARIIEVTGTKTMTAASLPDPPIDIINTDGTNFTLRQTIRQSLTGPQLAQVGTFVSSVWPGSPGDVSRLDFDRIVDETQTVQVRAKLFGTMTAATAANLPTGTQFRIRTKT